MRGVKAVKVKYKKLKEKVSKIKSFLQPEDISELQTMERHGKITSLYGNCSGNAMKIAAASKRLNLNNSRASSRRSIRSALPRNTFNFEIKESRCQSAPEMVQRRNYVTEVFIDAPTYKVKNKRPMSAFVPQSLNVTHRSPLEKQNQDVWEESASKKKETHTVEDLNLQPVKSWLAGTSLSASQHSKFSSHVTQDAREGISTAPAQYRRSREYSHMSNNSIDSNLRIDVYQERRQELLEEENERAATLDKRTRNFLQNVDTFLQKNIPLTQSHMSTENQSPSHTPFSQKNSKDPYSSDPSVKYHRRRGMGVEFDDTPTYYPENHYKEKLITLWKDMNKCRYLRVSDDKIDLSGINTLVKDQMKMYESLKQGDRAQLREAWENKTT